jgi:squalene synthase HpnC
VRAIYQFARTADDIADEGDATAQQRLLDLREYRQDLAAACKPTTDLGKRWSAVFVPLRAALQDFALPPVLLHDLLDAFVQDVDYTARGVRYASQEELLDYCRRSANPVGRLLLHLYGVVDPQALQCSDAICTALQLVNFWQDLSVDIPRGRHYLPLADCDRLGVTAGDLAARRQTPQATQLIAECVDCARASMHIGIPLVHALPGRAGWELRLVVQGGLRILDKIAALKFATLKRRPVLNVWDYAVMLWRAVWM